MNFNLPIFLILVTVQYAAPTSFLEVCKRRNVHDKIFMNCGYRDLPAIPYQEPSDASEYHWMGLKYNKITTVRKGAFSKFVNLEIILLSYNRIKIIREDSFNNFLLKLKVLDLSHNQIETVEKDAFRKIPYVTTLYLDSNKIRRLVNGNFFGLVNLKSFRLDHNQISAIDVLAFDGLAELRSLNISNNMMSEIKNGMFLGLYKLLDLRLDYNRIKSFDHGGFSGILHLRSIDLSYNRISEVKSNAFEAFFALSYLNLRGNALISTSKLHINKMRYLTTLDLSSQTSRKRLVLPLSLFSRFINKTSIQGVQMSIRIEDNNFHCLCGMKWLVYLLHHRRLPNDWTIPAFFTPTSTRGVKCNSINIHDKSFADKMIKICQK